MSGPTTRVLALLELLQTHGRMTGADIARRLDVDIRTVRRYITVLEELGIPVTSEQGRYGGYMLVAGFKLPPMMFTDEEAQAIALGLLAAGQLGLREATPAIASVQAKLERVMPAKLKRRVRAVGETIDIVLPPVEAARDEGALLRLTDAAQSQQQVEFSYQSQKGETTRRTLDPYGLVYRRGRWYICGFCHLREELRTFRLDRLYRVETLAATFLRPPKFDAADYLQRSIITAPREHPLSVLLHTDIATATRAMGEMEALFQQQEHGVLLHTATDSIPCFAHWLTCLPFRFTVLEPVELSLAVRERATALLAMGQDSNLPTPPPHPAPAQPLPQS
ncbi:helix-turn-helix transcriptional regulator [Kineobactrum salinum]|uniref:YafY family transcriptional regulator n=1 Tax=Kineobactrum salinum TaxID=2708301 RepID=A0A6C0UAA0_9GAMM|nr:YafY family protein [Kineobactrum salinum]QIB66714.1 YafY family transcriptional regulator [Kineobactrum salinum]